eukprot:Gb_31837 [translate_table: standard]
MVSKATHKHPDKVNCSGNQREEFEQLRTKGQRWPLTWSFKLPINILTNSGYQNPSYKISFNFKREKEQNNNKTRGTSCEKIAAKMPRQANSSRELEENRHNDKRR